MTHNQGENQEIFVNPDGGVVITCPSCEAVKTFKVDKFRDLRHTLNVKCRCQNLFQVNLDFRRFYRKPTKLSGYYILLPEKSYRHQMMVVNISKEAVGLQVQGDHRLTPGQEIQVCFTLDDKQGTLIDRRVVVRLVRESYVGCEFMGDTSHDKALGFYLMV